MGQLLGRRVVHVAIVGSRNRRGRVRLLGSHVHLELDVIQHRARLVEIRQQRAFAVGCRHPKRLQRRPGDDPGADRRCERLGLEGTQRLILPGLDVTRRPVVEEHVAEDHLVRLGHAHRLSHGIGGADDGAQLELDVETTARPEAREVGVGGPRLTERSSHARPAHHDRRRASVVADRDVQPVGWQRVVRAAEHRSDVERVLAARIEVGVLGDRERQLEPDVAPRNDRAVAEGGVALESRVAARCQQLGESRPDGGPGSRPEGHEIVQRRPSKDGRGPSGIEHTLRFEHGQIEDRVANRRAAPRSLRSPTERAVGQILNREVAVRLVGLIQPALQRQTHRSAPGSR